MTNRYSVVILVQLTIRLAKVMFQKQDLYKTVHTYMKVPRNHGRSLLGIVYMCQVFWKFKGNIFFFKNRHSVFESFGTFYYNFQLPVLIRLTW